MLIVAMPKSASTSLLHTLGAVHELPVEQQFMEDNPAPEGYRVLWRYHSDIRRIRNPAVVRRWTSPRRFHKQHMPPTLRHQALVEEHKKVVLLREPLEVVRAYRRAELRGIHAPRKEFRGCDSEAAWLRRAEDVGILDELRRFRDGWLDHSGDKLVITFDALTTAPTRTVTRVSRYFGLPEPAGEVELSKRRYSRRRGLRAIVRNALTRARDVVLPGDDGGADDAGPRVDS